jgi:hypothetical protein
MLRKMGRGDWIIFYSPKTAYPDGEPLQAEMTPDFYPWRRNVDFIEGKARWGYKFRFGGCTSGGRTRVHQLLQIGQWPLAEFAGLRA